MNKIKIFLAAPISGFGDEEKYSAYRKKLINFINSLKNAYVVYSEIEKIDDTDSYDKPGESAIEDFSNISNSDVFILFHPAHMQTSSFIELGYAIAKNKKIIIIADLKDLPYLALGLEEFSSSVKIIQSSEISEQTIDIALKELKKIEKLVYENN